MLILFLAMEYVITGDVKINANRLKSQYKCCRAGGTIPAIMVSVLINVVFRFER